MSILKGTLAAGAFTSVSGMSGAVTSSHPGQVLPGLRPEDVTVTASPNGHATIERIELLGPRAVVVLKLGDDKVVSVVEAGILAALHTGARVSLGFRPESGQLFDPAAGERL
jgi:multiple sugar transport system ATP-binding protein